MSSFSKGGLKVALRSLLLAALIAIRINLPAASYLDDPWAAHASLVMGFIVFALSASLAVAILSYLYRRNKKLPSSKNDNVLLGLRNIYYIVLTGAAMITILGFWNIDLKTLFTTLSIVAAAIAIISKDYVSEIISGIIISFSREVTIDDYVKIGEHKGKIIDINLTKIALLNEDDDVIFIPNNKVFTSEIVNYTRREIKKVSIEFEVLTAAIETVEELESDLIRSIQEYEAHIEPQSYNLKVVDIRKDSVSLKFQYILREINRELEREIRRKTVRRVVNYIKSPA
ncbi:mechanosensitive ion channel family protein [Phaeodactylibacter sp.]|uniref:mechanosensitive ion channel family protein n=1 Tax=Phaeodactylibacter sp. TaxID=1940289 RepID=UPI0025CF9C20|nr:mechanosensitive ion channel family protein [Phaeodactylibacter sp.]MCI4647731.1 mechanosensitive ion channel family protein [Phaeodactylibacter sp.]MCI5093763.1 mechanosensitive ion channel family protein [Phaeodactylibacter sp.]